MVDRFFSGRRPRPRFSASIGVKSFKIRYSSSLKIPLPKPASKNAGLEPKACEEQSPMALHADQFVHTAKEILPPGQLG